MDRQPTAVVVDKAERPEPIHEVTDPGSGGADHLREGLLIDVGDHGIELPVVAIMIQRQQDPGQALFAEVEKSSHEIFFDSNHPRKQIGNKVLGKDRVLTEDANQSCSFYPDDRGRLNCCGGRQPP